MKTTRERVTARLQHNRPMTTISLRMPEDVIDDLKEIAPMLGFTGYQPLIGSYIGQSLRRDFARLDGSEIEPLTPPASANKASPTNKSQWPSPKQD